MVEAVQKYLPVSTADWEKAVVYYQTVSEDDSAREATGVKRYWKEVMCNNHKKPTGKSGDANDLILKAQKVQLSILKKENMMSLGHESDGDESENGEHDELDEGIEEDELDEDDEENEDETVIAKRKTAEKLIFSPAVEHNHIKTKSSKPQVKFPTTPRTSGAAAISEVAKAINNASSAGGGNQIQMMYENLSLKHRVSLFKRKIKALKKVAKKAEKRNRVLESKLKKKKKKLLSLLNDVDGKASSSSLPSASSSSSHSTDDDGFN